MIGSSAGIGSWVDSVAGRPSIMRVSISAGFEPNGCSPVASSHASNAEGKEIRARIGIGAAQLLRRHVAGRARRGAGLGEAGDRRHCRESWKRASPKSRILIWPSVLRMMFSGFRSRWTMLRACAAARPEAIATSVGSRRSTGTGPRASSTAQRLAFDQLGGDVEIAVDLFEREDRRDGLVRERRRRARFAREAIAMPAVAACIPAAAP